MGDSELYPELRSVYKMRQRFLNLTFFVLLLTIMTMREWTPLMQRSEDDFAEFNDGAVRARESSTLAGGIYINQFLGRIADVLAQVRRRTEILTEWRIENNTTQWERSYASTSVERDLIEARFHVDNAEVYEWSIENRQKTMAELNQAERFLQDARPLLGKPALATIERVTKELEIMKIDATGEGASQPANYETVKTDLDRLIDSARAARL
jgi:hypothetical protein